LFFAPGPAGYASEVRFHGFLFAAEQLAAELAALLAALAALLAALEARGLV
jgi:hypothetical protein